jgi:hypothetical protein
VRRSTITLFQIFVCSSIPLRSPSQRTYAKSAVIGSSFSNHCAGRGIHDWSIRASAMPASRSASANCGTSQFLFLISTANLWSFGNFFRKGRRRARKSFKPENAFLLK